MKTQADLLEKTFGELEQVDASVEELDAPYGFFMLKNCCSLPNLLYFLRASTSFNHPALSERYDKTVRNRLSKPCNVNFDNFLIIQLALPAEMGCLWVSSASILALHVVLASEFGAGDVLTTIVSKSFNEKRLSLRTEQGSPLDGTQTKWTQSIYAKAAQDLISIRDDKRW